MGRSLKKGPFVDAKLYAKVVKMNETNNKSVIKTWSRSSRIYRAYLCCTQRQKTYPGICY